MATDSKFSLVYCTAPDADSAKQLADFLVNQQLAACVSIIPGITSVYPWQGKIESAQELLLVIKTRSDRFDQLAEQLKQQHPYELPEIIAVPITHGLTDYLQWINQSVTAP